MDGRGGCCIARYNTGFYDMSKADRIMLRFRPIAPKPVVSGSVSADSGQEKNIGVGARNGRGKRKYGKVSSSSSSSGGGVGKRCYRKKIKVAGSVVTLPLLPETPERKENFSPVKKNMPVWLSFDNGSGDGDGDQLGFRRLDRGSVSVTVPRTVASCVTVERVTDTWVEGEALGWTDEERRRNLERDTCPGFISDGIGKVTWTNEAYRKMVTSGSESESEMRVWLVMKEMPAVTWTAVGVGLKYPAFTCRVKVEYTCRKEKNSMTVPCDVWRMEGGGFAWRLDVKAALSLRLGR